MGLLESLCLVAFGPSVVLSSNIAVAFLHDLLKYPEPVGVEDEVAPVVLDFLSNFVSSIAEETFLYLAGEELPTWMENAKANHGAWPIVSTPANAMSAQSRPTTIGTESSTTAHWT